MNNDLISRSEMIRQLEAEMENVLANNGVTEIKSASSIYKGLVAAQIFAKSLPAGTMELHCPCCGKKVNLEVGK